MLKRRKAKAGPGTGAPKGRAGKAGFPWSGAPGPRPEPPRAGPGVAPAPPCGCSPHCKPQRGRLPARECGIIQVFSQFAHLCIGNEGPEESGWKLGGCSILDANDIYFFSFLKQVLSRHYKNYIYMILTFYSLLLPIRIWPV